MFAYPPEFHSGTRVSFRQRFPFQRCILIPFSIATSLHAYTGILAVLIITNPLALH
jgi:predicted membrane chloride channel (bestrophin family)